MSRGPYARTVKRTALGSVVAAVLVFLGIVLAVPATAHTELESTSPADGAALTTAPSQIDLVFSEAPLADAIDVSVTDPAGAVLASSLPATVTEATVSATWPAELSDGAYTVNYRVVSDDGHPISGSFSFTVGDASAAPATTDPAAAAEPNGGVPVGILVVVTVVGLAIVAVAIALVSRRNRDDRP